MGKINKVYLISIVLILFFSCKNNTETKLNFSEEDTIKKTVKTRESSITWSIELEEKRLTDKISNSNEKINKDVYQNTEVLKIIHDFQRPLYPEINDFGKLDTSSLTYNLKEYINDFCLKLSTADFSSLNSYFLSDYIFNCVFFINELKDILNNNFGFDEYIKETHIFTKWILGEPFIGENILQIPVRFYCIQGSVDVTLYLNSKNKYSIYQITIDRWDINDRKE